VRVYVLAATLADDIKLVLADNPCLQGADCVIFDSADAVTKALGAGDRGLVIVECAEHVEDISHIRAADTNTPLIAIGEGSVADEARHVGADDVLQRSELNPASLTRAVAYAAERREAHRSEVGLLESFQTFGESLVGEDELETVVDRVLAEVVERTDAETGYLVCEWEWNGRLDRVDAVHGLELPTDVVHSLADHPAFSPFHLGAGRHHIASGSIPELHDRLGPISSLVVVPIARKAKWGRGGIVLAHSTPNAISEPGVRIATGLAAWAGVAIMHAGIVRDRNQAVEVRERVLAVASHDLRNPLSVFNMALELLADTEDEEEHAEIIERAERSVLTMRRLISDLLDYAALDAGNLAIEKAPTSPSTPATQALESVKHLIAKKRLTQSLFEPEKDPTILIDIDAGRITQSLTNLLTNAIKFTPPGGHIGVEVRHLTSTTTYVVSDTGPGIDQEQQRRLFDRYYTRARSGSGKGIGLGLSIARGIADGHGGTLLVESTVGEGARFLLTVPNEDIS